MTSERVEARLKQAAARMLGSPWLVGAVVAAFIALLVCASVPWPRTRFIAKLQTTAIGLTIQREATLQLGLESVGDAGLAIERAEVTVAPVPEFAPLTAGRVFSGLLMGVRPQIATLRLGPGSELT